MNVDSVMEFRTFVGRPFHEPYLVQSSNTTLLTIAKPPSWMWRERGREEGRTGKGGKRDEKRKVRGRGREWKKREGARVAPQMASLDPPMVVPRR